MSNPATRRQWVRSRIPRTAGAMDALARACHPAPTVAVTTLSALLAGATGVKGKRLPVLTGAVLLGQLGIGWSNDLIDRRRDQQAGRTTKPLASEAVTPIVAVRATAVSVCGCVGLSLATGRRAGALHLAAVAGGWAYNAGLKRTPLSPVPYAVSFALLPAFLVRAADRTPPRWLLAAGGILGVGAHFLNSLPDIPGDRATGIRSLPVLMGADAARVTGAALLLAAGLQLTVGRGERLGRTDVVALGAVSALSLAAATAGRPGSSLPFRLAIAAAAVDVLVILSRSRTLSPTGEPGVGSS